LEPKPTGYEYVGVVEQVESIKVGDFVVGLLAVLAAKELGAERIIAMSRHADRQALARSSAPPTSSRNVATPGTAKVKELTDGLRAHSVVEAVGTQESMMQTIAPPAPAATSGSSVSSTPPWTNGGRSRSCSNPDTGPLL
jgi:threonine dehydrogenase-like Zn-dependent dehydrogenase